MDRTPLMRDDCAGLHVCVVSGCGQLVHTGRWGWETKNLKAARIDFSDIRKLCGPDNDL